MPVWHGQCQRRLAVGPLSTELTCLQAVMPTREWSGERCFARTAGSHS